jgi:REP element-mobilizing transposase RayT
VIRSWTFRDNGITKLELGNEGESESRKRPTRARLVPKLKLGNALVFEALLRQRMSGMRSRYGVHHPDRAHFVTCTIVEWLPVFTSSACCDVVVKSLLHCRQHKSLKIHAWVILDNHFHAILAASDLSSVLRDLKSFTAQEILQQLAAEGRDWLLNQLHYYRGVHKPNQYQNTCTIIRSSVVGSARPSIGATRRRMNGSAERCRYCDATSGSNRFEAGASQTSAFPSLSLGTRIVRTLVRRRLD